MFILEIIANFLIRIITNPRFEAFAIIGITNLIRKKMENETMDTTVEKIKNSQPLFLPRGTVRAIITMLFMITMIASFVFKFPLPEEFYALGIFAVGYYVGYRSDNTQLPEIK